MIWWLDRSKADCVGAETVWQFCLVEQSTMMMRYHRYGIKKE